MLMSTTLAKAQCACFAFALMCLSATLTRAHAMFLLLLATTWVTLVLHSLARQAHLIKEQTSKPREKAATLK